MTSFSLAYLTVPELSATQMIDIASSAGYRHVGLRLHPPRPGMHTHGLVDDKILLDEAMSRCRETGVTALDIEFIWLEPDFDARRHERLGEVAAQLGARSLLVGARDPDAARLASSYGSLCEVMLPYGLSVELEFIPFLGSTVRDIGAAQRLIEAAASPANAGVLVDAIHLARSNGTLDQVAALPRKWLHYAQLCDAPLQAPATEEEMAAFAGTARLAPGEGELDLKGLLASLPAGLPISLEVPHLSISATIGAKAWAQRVIDRARMVASGGLTTSAASMPMTR